MGLFNVLVLRSLGAATQQQDQSEPVLRVANPVARAVIDPRLVDAAARVLPVTEKVFREPVQASHDAQTGCA